MQTKLSLISLFKSERADLYEEFLEERQPTVVVSINSRPIILKFDLFRSTI